MVPKSRWWRAAWGLLAAEVGLIATAVLTFALVTVAPSPGGLTAAFTDSSDYFVWRLLIALLVVASFVGAATALPRLADLRRIYPDANMRSLALVYLPGVTAAVALHWLGNADKGLSWSTLSARILVMLVVVATAVAPVIGLIWIVRDRVHRLAGDDAVPPTDEAHDRIRELLTLRRVLTTALGILAGVISLTVVATGQLRQARIASGADAADWPITGVILYGAVFAAVLALIYVPVHLTWRAAAEAVRDALYPIPAGGRPDATWAEGRKRLSELLTIETGLAGSLGAAFTILSPFLVSLLGYFLPKP